MSQLEQYKKILQQVQPVTVAGRVVAVRGLTVSVGGFPAPVGAGCRILCGGKTMEARVVGFCDSETLVMPLDGTTGICHGDQVECTTVEPTVPVGNDMLGRVVDGMARPIDDKGPIAVDAHAELWPRPISAMRRERITDPLCTGVKVIDAMLTVGVGQRMCILSGSGVGKSVLLGMIGRNARVDVTVVGLIGERGREVRDFVERDLGPDGLEHSVVVVSTGDDPPLLRLQAGATATAIAEFFRAQGKNVLLLMDSLTRLAMAQRQIGLVAGEPPTSKGYTPSVFNLLPRLLERGGRTEQGSITGFYTVLAESDELNDPISDAVKSVTDGHIMLSRQMANRGQYPAVDCLRSVSRVMGDIASPEHMAAWRKLHGQLALHDEIRDMCNIGAYKAGSSVQHDAAIQAELRSRALLSQRCDETFEMKDTVDSLIELVGSLASSEKRTKHASRMPLSVGRYIHGT